MGRRPFRKQPRASIIQVAIPQRDHWNEILRALPTHHVLQTWEWGEFKQRYGWRAERLAFRHGDRIVAAAQILARQASPLPVSILYVPKGPALDYADRPLRIAVLRALAAHARRRRAVFIKIDPDVVLGTGIPGTDEDIRIPTGVAFCQDLTAAGWRFSGDQIQFRNTVQLDLRQSDEDLLAVMKQKTRYNIRLAGRKGVEVRRGSKDDLRLLFEMYAETAERDGFIIRPLSYYRNAWGAFMEAGLACPLIAEHEGEALGAVILFAFGDRAWYMYGASRDVHRDKMPNQLLQWEAMRWAKGRGATIYDMWGAPNEFDEDDPMYGVWRFKAGFGGQVVRHIGAWDRVISRPWHWIYTFVIPLYLHLRRSLKR
jgi:peptidoglycan pentaglycine glycine transferase (the first glycine)